MTNQIINICLYEDDLYAALHPLTTQKPAYDLLVGIDTLYDKVTRYFGFGNITLHCRNYLKKTVKEEHPDLVINQINTGTPCLFINARAIMTKELYTVLAQIDNKHSYLYTHNGQVVACYLRGDLLDIMKKQLSGTPNSKNLIQEFRAKCVTKEIESVYLLSTPWDIIHVNEDILKLDFQFKNTPGIIKGDIKPFSVLYNENNIFIDANTVVEDFVVLNAENGPIYIEENVYIEANTRLEGPLFIGKNSHILGGKIRHSSIGKHCKVSGEVSNSIFQRFSNKAHQGYLGHSYIGEWVNLGAQTTTSNLKSNYSNIKVEINNKTIDTNQIFLGSIIGDHVKTSIGTTLNTGTIIHIGSTLFNNGFHNKSIAPFSWGSPGVYEKQDIDKLIQTAQKMMQRRNIHLSDNQKEVLTYLHSTL